MPTLDDFTEQDFKDPKDFDFTEEDFAPNKPKPLPALPGGYTVSPISTSPTGSPKPLDVDATPIFTTPLVHLPKFTVGKDDSVPGAVAKSAANLAIGVPEFLTSPIGLAAAAFSMVPGVAPAVSALFAADLAHSVSKQSTEAGRNWDEMTPAEQAAAVTDIVGTGAFATLAGSHAVKGALPETKPIVPDPAIEREAAMGGKPIVEQPPKFPGFINVDGVMIPEVETKGETNARNEPQATKVHESVPPQPAEGAKEVPAEESGTGVQPPGPEETKPEVLLTGPEAAKQVGARFDGEVAGNWQFTALKADGTEGTSFIVKKGSPIDKVRAKYEATRQRYLDADDEANAPRPIPETKAEPETPQAEAERVAKMSPEEFEKFSPTGTATAKAYDLAVRMGVDADRSKLVDAEKAIVAEQEALRPKMAEALRVKKEGEVPTPPEEQSRLFKQSQILNAKKQYFNEALRMLTALDNVKAGKSFAEAAKAPGILPDELEKFAEKAKIKPKTEAPPEPAKAPETPLPEPAKVETPPIVGEASFEAPQPIPEADPVLHWLDQAIESLSTNRGKTLEGILGAPVWITKDLARGALQAVRLAYQGGKKVAEAIEDGVAWLRTQQASGFNENEARSWLASAKKSTIEQLDDTFKTIEGAKVPFAQKVKDAFAFGQKLAGVKDAVAQAVGGLKTSGDFLLQKWKGVKTIDEMLRAKGELSAEIEKRGWRTRQFVKTVTKQFPDVRQRSAISKWIDAGGDAAELQRGLAETKPEFKQAYQDALNLKGDALTAAKAIRKYFEQRLDEAIQAGVLENGVEDYIHRLYEDRPKAAKAASAYFGSGILSENPGLAKKRIFQWDWEAEKLGYKPVQDFLPRVAQYEASLTRAIAARQFIKKATTMRAPDGRPVLDVAGLGVPIENQSGVREATLIKPGWKPSDPASPLKGRTDYVERDYPALRKWKWATTDAGGKPIFVQGNLLVHPDFAGRIDTLLKPSAVRSSALGRGSLAISSTIKQTMLDLSGFHQTQITVHGMEHKVLPWKITQAIDFENPNIEGLLRGGLTLGGEYHANHLSEGLAGRALTRHIPGLGPLTEAYHNWLFQDYIPRIKATMAQAALERNRARYKGNMTDEQIFAKTAAEANSAFGELNYTTLERSKTLQDVARLILLAPDFLEARARFVGGALEKGGKLFGNEQRTALLLGAITMYITARIFNKTVDDQYHLEPENAFSVVYKGNSYSLRTVQGDVLHLLEHPAQFWMHRLNPTTTRPIMEATTGRDYFGRKRNAMEQAWDAVSTATPISLRSSRERSLFESLANSFGITARRYNDVDDAFKLAEKWKEKNGVMERGEFIYDPDKDPLRGLKIALSKGDQADAAKEITRLLKEKKISRDKLDKYFDRYASMPFAGSQSNDEKFIASLTQDEKQTVESARKHRQSIRLQYLKAQTLRNRQNP